MLLTLILAVTASHAETARPADSVADSVGVNTHFGDTTSPYYLHSDLAISLMQQLAVRHYRDGITYLGAYAPFPAQSFALFNQLGKDGIHGDYIVNCTATVAQNAAILGTLNNVEAIEYPNEYDVTRIGQPRCGTARRR